MIRRIVWAIVLLIALVIAVPVLLYVPAVQQVVKDYATSAIKKSTGLDVSIDRLLVKFPLNVSVDGLLVLTEKSDTMVAASNLNVGLKFRPLLKLNIEADNAEVKNFKYKMMSEDSSLVLRVNAMRGMLAPASLNLTDNKIDISDAQFGNGRVELLYYTDKVQPSDKEKSKGWHITAQHISLDSVTYAMRMLPTIDLLTLDMTHAELTDGVVDTDSAIVRVGDLAFNKPEVKYFTPSAEYLAAHPAVPDTTTVTSDEGESQTWVVTSQRMKVTDGKVLYAMSGVKPAAGMDFSYLDFSELNLDVNNFLNRGTEVVIPIDSISGVERSGLKVLSGNGTFAMRDEQLHFEALRLNTMASEFSGDATVAMSWFDEKPSGPLSVKLDSKIDLGEIAMIYPSYKPMLKSIPQHRPLEVNLDVEGDEKLLKVDRCNMAIPSYFNAKMDGRVINAGDVNKLSGDLALKGEVKNVDFAKAYMPASMRKQVNIPPMKIDADLHMRGNTMSGDMQVLTGGGELACDATFTSKAERYDVAASFDRFPVNTIMPSLGLGKITGSFAASGKGFDFEKVSTNLLANCNIEQMTYNGRDYQGIVADVRLHEGLMNAAISSSNPNLNLDLTGQGQVNGKHYMMAFDGDINDLNLTKLGLMDTVECHGKSRVNVFADIDLATMQCDGTLQLDDLQWTYGDYNINAPSVSAVVNTTDSTIYATFDNSDLHMRLDAGCGVEEFAKKMGNWQKIMTYQIDNKKLNIDSLRTALPLFNCTFDMGENNVVQQILSQSDMKVRKVSLDMTNDSTITIDGFAHGFSMGETKLDTITLASTQKEKYLSFVAHVGNRPGTFDEFASVTVQGGVNGRQLGLFMEQRNIRNKVGYRFGTKALLMDSAVRFTLFPKESVVGYRKWEVNDSNFITYNMNSKQFDADLRLQSDTSYIALNSKRSETEPGLNDIFLKIGGLHIGEWLNWSPFATPVDGVLATDMKITTKNNKFWGDGLVKLNNFTYDNQNVGNLAMNVKAELDPATGKTELYSNMLLDGAKVVFVTGSLADAAKSEPMQMELEFDNFPLEKANAFVPGGLAKLDGYLNGVLKVGGTSDKPVLDGDLTASKGLVNVPLYGVVVKLPETPIRVDSSVVTLKNYDVRFSNSNPLTLNGKVDLNNMDNAYVDLAVSGRNVQFLNAKQQKRSELFGRGYANLDASVKGRLDRLNVRAFATLLAGSNITYVMTDDVSQITNRTDNNMVTFVNFNDSTLVSDAEKKHASTSSSMAINASLTVQEGAIVNCYLSRDGNNRVQAEGSGSFTYNQGFVGEPRMLGRYTIDEGYVRYKPQVISQKNFAFESGSYVEFMGDMMNPNINVTGVEKKKLTVKMGNQGSHLVDFDITAKVKGSLNVMDVTFDLSSTDMTVQNELQSMSPSQRQNEAINIMLYNSYSGGASSGLSLDVGNPLYSFLQSQLNSWAQSAIKGVDLSFGIDQYESVANGQSQTATSYSYKLSKSLFNDRFKIVVGGNYSTDASSEENFAENLVNDISFEYLLNKTGSMYVRLFRHKGFESVLEGEITETGAGFVMKRKISSLKHLFRFSDIIKRRRQSDTTSVAKPDSVRHPIIIRKSEE